MLSTDPKKGAEFHRVKDHCSLQLQISLSLRSSFPTRTCSIKPNPSRPRVSEGTSENTTSQLRKRSATALGPADPLGPAAPPGAAPPGAAPESPEGARKPRGLRPHTGRHRRPGTAGQDPASPSRPDADPGGDKDSQAAGPTAGRDRRGDPRSPGRQRGARRSRRPHARPPSGSPYSCPRDDRGRPSARGGSPRGAGCDRRPPGRRAGPGSVTAAGASPPRAFTPGNTSDPNRPHKVKPSGPRGPPLPRRGCAGA